MPLLMVVQWKPKMQELEQSIGPRVMRNSSVLDCLASWEAAVSEMRQGQGSRVCLCWALGSTRGCSEN